MDIMANVIAAILFLCILLMGGMGTWYVCMLLLSKIKALKNNTYCRYCGDKIK